jgi:ribosomal protein S18 acetylase RimI-like enzyme
MAIEIATFSIEDYDDVVAFWKSQEGVGLNESDSREAIAAYLRRNPGMSFVAREGETLVGASLCGHDGRRGSLHHLAVTPSHRRQGLGRRLVERCLTELKPHGITRCNLMLFTDNDEGAGFWNALGFRHRSDVNILQRVIE